MRPKQLLKELSHKMPNIWDQVKRFRAGKGKNLPNWPDWCYLPLSAGYAISTRGGPPNKNLFDTLLNPASIMALATWRISQGVYRFDADLFNELVCQPFGENLPCEAFKLLPEWCVYIEMQGVGLDMLTSDESMIVEGFFAHLEWDVKTGREELRLLVVNNTGFNIPVALHLGDWSLEESLQKMKEEADKNAKPIGINIPEFGKIHANAIAPFLQLILYICAENADIPVPPQHPSNRVRMSGQVDVAKEVRVWNVGERIGTAIRKYRNEQVSQSEHTTSTHASPRPHIRRAHWHHFWKGPKTGDRTLILRWLPPIPVGIKEDADMPVVIHKVL